MPAVINSAPDCVTHNEVYSADDAADFVINDNYQECTGFMTFGPGSTYGEEGTGADTAYMALTWIGIAFMVFTIIAWMLYENRRLITFAKTRGGGASAETAASAAQESELA